ncbi:PiggyBac transposable element-derived protein 4, partial [Stegodyphus mimosarum]
MLTRETNRYASQILELRPDISGKRKHESDWSPVTSDELQKFLGLVLLMGHIEKDSIRDYWSTDDLTDTPIFRKIMSRDRFLMILKFLHFENNKEKPDKIMNYDRLWKIRNVFDHLKTTYKQVYSPAEELAIDEIIVKFKGRVIFRQYIPKKRKQWGIKLYKIADKEGYTYDMEVYLGKDKAKDPNFSASYNVVKEMSGTIRDKGHKLFMDNFFSSPELFVYLLNENKINSCGTIRPNRKHFPKDVSRGKLNRGETTVRFTNGMTALRWKDKRDVFMLSNMHNPMVIADDQTKPDIITCYNKNMGYVDLSDRMANSYTFGRRTLKWTKKLFFHLLDLTVLNAYILSKISNIEKNHKVFRMNLIRELIHYSDLQAPTLSPSSRKKQCKYLCSHFPFDTKKRRRCAVCSAKGLQRRSTVICKACDVALCINCFEAYHTVTGDYGTQSPNPSGEESLSTTFFSSGATANH